MVDTNRTALVTGANRGIGQHVAKELARAGWNVLVGARDRAKGEAAAARVKKEGAGRAKVRFEALDVADQASVDALAERLTKAKIRLAALVNNAGIYGEARDPRNYRRVVEVNFHGPRRVTDALAPLLEEHANVVMVSSGIGELASLPPKARARLAAEDLEERGGAERRGGSPPGGRRADQGRIDRAALLALVEEGVRAAEAGRLAAEGFPRDSYGFSKASLNALARVLAAEHPGWRVNAVCPGWVRTDMGGRGAPRSVEEGASGVVWAATLAPDGPTGGFFRDGRRIPF